MDYVVVRIQENYTLFQSHFIFNRFKIHRNSLFFLFLFHFYLCVSSLALVSFHRCICIMYIHFVIVFVTTIIKHHLIVINIIIFHQQYHTSWIGWYIAIWTSEKSSKKNKKKFVKYFILKSKIRCTKQKEIRIVEKYGKSFCLLLFSSLHFNLFYEM